MGMDREERELLRDSARAFLAELWADAASELPEGATTPAGDKTILRRTWERAAAQSWMGVEAEADTREVAINILGPSALLSAVQPGACADGAYEDQLRQSVMMIVGGGSAEIQRNIIAQQVPGLPR